MTILSLVPKRKRSQQVALVVVTVFVSVIAGGCLVWAGVQAYSAYDERGQAGRFLGAPRCPASASPSGDCSAWLTQRVSRIDNYKSGSYVDLAGGLKLSYGRPPGWVTGLTAGESVPVLVWQGSAQALRNPDGHVLYADNSALLQGFNDIGGAVVLLSEALLIAVLAFAISPWFRRRARDVVLAVVLGDAGVSGFTAGITIEHRDSIDAGVKIGVIVFCAVGGLAATLGTTLWVWRFRRMLRLAARTR